MKKSILISLCLVSLLGGLSNAEELSPERQKEVIENYLYVTGRIDQLNIFSAGEEELVAQLTTIKCGMPAVVDFVFNRDKIDKSMLKSLGIQVEPRRTDLTQSLTSPSGKFLIHYNTTGKDAVFSNSNIVPGGSLGYVDSVAVILDEVYNHIVNTLGYPAPPTDEFYPSGGDNKYDIYLVELSGAAFGLTYPDSISFDAINPITATSFIQIDNDFQEIFSYQNRPLDAVRVTCAHEFFHMVQFGIDVTETEMATNGIDGPTWMEMSSTWMEEEVYDAINDYYNYLPFFFDSPWASIQQFKSVRDFHPYASMLFPLFLSEKYGVDMIREIWLRCGSFGGGPSFLLATEQVIDSISGGLESLASSFSEFALWNYFTGSRVNLAPPGIGYSERQFFNNEYSNDPDTGVFAVHSTYPKSVMGNQNPFNPDHNAAFYLEFDKLWTIVYDTTFDTLSGAIVDVDSVFTVSIALEIDFTQSWGFNVIYHLVVNNQDSIIVDQLALPPGENFGIGVDFIDPRQYRSITLIFSPASSVRSFYKPVAPYGDYYVAYFVFENGELSIDCPLDTVDVFLTEPGNFCHFIDVSPATAVVTTSLGSFADDSLCFNVDAPGIYEATIIAVEDTLADTCNVVFNINIGSLAVMAPYPNPVVVSELAEPKVVLKIKLPGGFISPVALDNPYLVVDIFNIAGEFIRTLHNTTSASFNNPDEGEYWTEWDLKNESGRNIASGVYIAYARFYSSETKGELLTEVRTKIAVIK